MARKGMSLPIEMIVIIAVAVLVLVVIVAFFVGGAGQQVNLITDRDALARGCTQLVLMSGGCQNSPSAINISSYKATCGGKTGSTLDIACCKVGFTNEADCKTMGCSCPA